MTRTRTPAKPGILATLLLAAMLVGWPPQAAPAQDGLNRDASAADIANGGAAEVDRPSGTESADRLSFNFRNAPWDQVLQWLADQSELSFSADVIPRGTFTYVDQNRKFTANAAIDLVNSYLMIKGYTVVRHQKMLLVVDLEDDLDRRLVSELVTEISLEELDKRGRYEILKTRFTLKTADAKVAEQQIAPLLSPVGSLIVMPEAKQILATDTGDTLRAIREVLGTLEREANAKATKLHTFRLKMASADEVLIVARPLLEIPEDEHAAEDGSIRISADPLGRTVFATGTPAKIELVKQIVEQVDGDAANTSDGGPVDPPQFMLHPIRSGDSAAILRVLQTLFVGDPSIRLEVDASTGSVLAYAKLSHHQSIRATIAEMEQSPQELVVIPLRITDPKIAVDLVDKLFKTSTTPPIVDGTRDPRQLVIRGTEAQVQQVRGLLASMGEQTGIEPEAPRGNVRIFNSDPESSIDLLHRLQQIWPRVSDQPLQIVPVQETPMLRTIRPSASRRPLDSDSLEWDRPGSPPRQARHPGVSDHEARRNLTSAALHHVAYAPPATPQVADTYENETDGNETEANETEANDEVETGEPAGENKDADLPETDSLRARRLPVAGPAVTAPPSSASGIVVTQTPDGLLIASEDRQALDTIVKLLAALQNSQTAGGAQFHLFYLKHIEADSALELLGGILSGTGVGSLVSSTVSSAAATASPSATGRAVVAPSSAGAPHMVADKRLNALFVQGTAAQITMVEQLLEVLDNDSGPEEVLTFPRPQFIPVHYAKASDVAEVLKQLYVNRLETGQNNQRNEQSGGSPFSRFFGGRDRGGRDSQNTAANSTTAGQLPRMTIAVDEGSNSVVVAAVGPLLKEVEAVVREIDVRAESKPADAVTVVTLKRTNPVSIQQALVGLLGDQVQVSGTAARSAAESTRSTASASRNSSIRSGSTSGRSTETTQTFIPGQFGGRGNSGGGDFGGGRGGRSGGDSNGGRRGRGGN